VTAQNAAPREWTGLTCADRRVAAGNSPEENHDEANAIQMYARVCFAAFTVSICANAQRVQDLRPHGPDSWLRVAGVRILEQQQLSHHEYQQRQSGDHRGAVNISTSITDKFRVGAQGYARKIGSLDDGRPQLDWAYGDYKFANWFGVRAGKVKTALGLYNDTQDMDFLHLWALLPQGVYPADLRTTYISHTGGDLYGRIPLKKLGKLDYTAYAGTRSFDNRGGFFLFTTDNGFNIQTINGTWRVGT